MTDDFPRWTPPDDFIPSPIPFDEIPVGATVEIPFLGETAHVEAVVENFIYPDHPFYILDIDYNGSPAVFHAEALNVIEPGDDND